MNKHGQKIVRSCFVIIYSKNFASKAYFPEDKFYFGMKVSKKFAKSAVYRNFAKRRIRAAISEIAKEYDDLAGSGIIVIPKKHFNQTSFAKITSELTNCFTKTS